MKKVLAKLFYCGQYLELLKASVDANTWTKSTAELPFVIGALSFTGRMEEARLLAEEVFKKKSLSEGIQTRFFLGLGYTRLSEYKTALQFFAQNLQLARQQSLKPADLFFVYQGLSFYRYYCGRFKSAKKASDIAFQAAFAGDDLYGKLLSTDIRSHILMQTGETLEAFELMTRAEDLATRLKNGSVATAIRISRMIYRARLGMNPERSLQDLFGAVDTLAPEDNYSLAAYLLELARQLILRGRLREANLILDRASDSIYAHQNRRQEATLNLRYSTAMYSAGEYSRSLSFIRSAKRTLQTGIDRVLEKEILGQEIKVLKAIGMQGPADEIQNLLVSKSLGDSHFVNRRMISRNELTNSTVEIRKGADPLGDLLDLLKTDSEAGLEAVLKDGYFGLLYDTLGIDRKKTLLYIDLRPGLLISFDRGEVSAHSGLTNLHRRILKSLEKGPVTKEKLFSKAWELTYDPLRHDAVIYTGITSLRKLLGDKSHWLETVENGYRWHTACEMQFHKDAPSEKNTAFVFEDNDMSPTLNQRQIKALRHLRKKEFLAVQDYKFLFGISDITASRDLSSLVETGHVVRVGRGRATCYKLRKPS